MFLLCIKKKIAPILYLKTELVNEDFDIQKQNAFTARKPIV